MPATAGAKEYRALSSSWFSSLGLNPDTLKPRRLPGVRVLLSCRKKSGGPAFRHEFQSKTAFQKKAIEQAYFDAEFVHKLDVVCLLIVEAE
jgi:hypothetical protein